MNLRLKQLMIDHGLHKHVSEDCQHRLELLYKLVVQECVQTIIDNTPVTDEYDPIEDWDKGYIRAMIDCVHHIEDNFGVLE